MKVVCINVSCRWNSVDYQYTFNRWSTGSIYDVCVYFGDYYVSCDKREFFKKGSIEEMGVEFIDLREYNLNKLV